MSRVILPSAWQGVVDLAKNQIVVFGRISVGKRKEWKATIVVYTASNFGGEGRESYGADRWELGRAMFTTEGPSLSAEPYQPLSFSALGSGRILRSNDEPRITQITADLEGFKLALRDIEAPRPFNFIAETDDEYRPLQADNNVVMDLLLQLMEAIKYNLGSAESWEHLQLLQDMYSRMRSMRDDTHKAAYRRALSPFAMGG